MEKILIGTGNPGKVEDMIPLLKERGFAAVSGGDFPVDPEETGRTPAENAALKARAYCQASGLPTLSFDSGLYILDLPLDDPRQPGLNVRRVGGKRLSDQEMITHYAALAHELGGRVLCQFVTGFGAALPDGRVRSGDDHEGQSRDWQFYLVDKPQGVPQPGKPLHAISVEADSGLYFTQQCQSGSSAVRRRKIRERAVEVLMEMMAEGPSWPPAIGEKVEAVLSQMGQAAEAQPLRERLEILRAAIDGVLSAQPAPVRQDGYIHLHGVAQAAILLAKVRGEDPELAAMAGMLHDLYGYATGDVVDHAHKGAVFAGQVLEHLGLATAAEREKISGAIYHHSDKGKKHGPFEEILIDADVLQHTLYNPLTPASPHERERFAVLCRELGIRE